MHAGPAALWAPAPLPAPVHALGVPWGASPPRCWGQARRGCWRWQRLRVPLGPSALRHELAARTPLGSLYVGKAGAHSPGLSWQRVPCPAQPCGSHVPCPRRARAPPCAARAARRRGASCVPGVPRPRGGRASTARQPLPGESRSPAAGHLVLWHRLRPACRNTPPAPKRPLPSPRCLPGGVLPVHPCRAVGWMPGGLRAAGRRRLPPTPRRTPHGPLRGRPGGGGGGAGRRRSRTSPGRGEPLPRSAGPAPPPAASAPSRPAMAARYLRAVPALSRAAGLPRCPPAAAAAAVLGPSGPRRHCECA